MGGLSWLGDRGGLGSTVRDACWLLRSLTSFVTTSQLEGAEAAEFPGRALQQPAGMALPGCGINPGRAKQTDARVMRRAGMQSL